MRKTGDRIRHALSFEILGILLATPFASILFHLPGEQSAVLVVASALVAMAWNYLYNLGFDHLLTAWRGTTAKSAPMRIAHALLFELGLLVVMLPLVSWYLGIGLWEALVMDLALAGFYMAYAFAFNWAYDRVFPLPEWQQEVRSGH